MPKIDIVSGPLVRPEQTLIYGIAGIGKTTLAAEIARVFNRRMLFIDTEFGTRVPVDRVHVHSIKEWEAVIEYLTKDKHEIDIVAIDTITSFEPLVENELVLLPQKFTASGKKIIRMGDFEYGKGSVYLREAFDRILYFQLDELVKRGISVLLIGHAQVTRVNLPELIEGFDRYELAMDKKVGATLRQWVDNMLFCNWDFKVTTNESDQTRGIAGKERVIFTQHAAAYDAKNRAGLADKLKWDVQELAPLFDRVTQLKSEHPAATESANGEQDHKAAWLNLLNTINAEQWQPDDLTAFFKSRFPTFDGANYLVVPGDYIRRATEKPEAFKTTINEFIAFKTAHAQPAQPA